MSKRYKLFVDGASKGNPGPAGSGAIIKTENNEDVIEVTKFLGTATNNVAEYTALIIGLQKALEINIKCLSIYSDSELIVKQITRVYKIKHPDMIPLSQEVFKLMAEFEDVSIEHVRREFNKEADKLANQAVAQGK